MSEKQDDPIVDAMVKSLGKNICPICDTPLQEIGHCRLILKMSEWRTGSNILEWQIIVGCPKCRSVFWKKKEE